MYSQIGSVWTNDKWIILSFINQIIVPWYTLCQQIIWLYDPHYICLELRRPLMAWSPFSYVAGHTSLSLNYSGKHHCSVVTWMLTMCHSINEYNHFKLLCTCTSHWCLKYMSIKCVLGFLIYFSRYIWFPIAILKFSW